jgi:hypothetical protein
MDPEDIELKKKYKTLKEADDYHDNFMAGKTLLKKLFCLSQRMMNPLILYTIREFLLDSDAINYHRLCNKVWGLRRLCDTYRNEADEQRRAQRPLWLRKHGLHDKIEIIYISFSSSLNYNKLSFNTILLERNKIFYFEIEYKNNGDTVVTHMSGDFDVPVKNPHLDILAFFKIHGKEAHRIFN